MTPTQIERMALWAVLLILVLVVVISQRRSGFTPSTGAPISLMDLQEYSYLNEDKKKKYIKALLDAKSELISVANDQIKYTNKLNDIMKTVFTVPPTETQPPTAARSPQAPPPTGSMQRQQPQKPAM